MTERKPPGMSMESWVDRQIREASDRGAFDDLAGRGKPLPGLDQPYDDTWWIKEKMRTEGLSFLPPSLVVRKEVEEALDEASRSTSEEKVRRIVAEVNAKIAEALRRPQSGPALNLKPIDVEEYVDAWRAERPADGA
jgi:hypothetical protein